MSGLSRKVKRLQRKNSQSHIFLLFLLLLVIGGCALAARFYAVAPVKIMDASMAPLFKEHSIHMMCKLPQCLSQVKDKDIVWLTLKSGETMVRNVLAMPGDTIEITDKERVYTPNRNFKWKGEDAFIQSRKIYVPKAGDTLYFDQLNDVEQDYILAYLHTHGKKVVVKSSLWQGDREINIDRVGSTKIANRQVSLKEIDFLPWQDRYLIELQIRQSEPGNAPIKIKRSLFRLKPKKIDIPQSAQADSTETAQADSSAVHLDSTNKQTDSIKTVQADSTKTAVEKKVPQAEEFFDEPINEIIVEDDCYYLACSKGSSCPDSRELGYFTRNDFIGRYMAWPDQIKDEYIKPIYNTLKRGFGWVYAQIASILF